MYNLELGVFKSRFSIDDLPVAFKNYFSKCSDIHDYPTRHGSDLNPTVRNHFQTILFVRVAPFCGIRYLQQLKIVSL